MPTSPGSTTSSTESRESRGVNKTLMVLLGLTLVGIVVTMLLGERTFEKAGVTTPVVVPFAWALFVGIVFTTLGAAAGSCPVWGTSACSACRTPTTSSR